MIDDPRARAFYTTTEERRPILLDPDGDVMAVILLHAASDSMPPESEDPEERALANLVLGYLGEHPHAMETLDGIAEWWIERRRIRVDVEALSHVLEKLTEGGTLEAIGTGPSRRYRLRQPPGKT